MKHRFPGIYLFGGILLAAVLAPADTPVLDIDFTAAEGFSDGVVLDGTQGMSTQPTWFAGDAAGTGYAATTSAYSRARNFAGFTLGVDHSVVIETTLRLDDADGIFSDADNFKIGFAEQLVHPGQSTPSIGSTIHTYGDGGYWIGGGDPDSRIGVAAADRGDWIRFVQVITRSSVSNTFTGWVAASNLTDGVDLGIAAANWTESTADGSWGGTMRPSFRSLANAKATALEIDHWVVYTTTNAPPTPPVPTTNAVVVSIDLVHQLYIGGVSAFKRDRVVNWHDIGSYSDYSASEAAMMIDTNKARFGRSVGGLEWIRNQVQTQDPLRPGYINTNSLASWCLARKDGLVNDWPWRKLGYQPLVYTDHTSIHPDDYKAGIFNPTNHEAAAEWATTVWKNYWTDPKRPRYYEPVNEPFVNIPSQQNVVDFHAAVIDRMHQQVPGVKVGGPCMAWPVFSLNDYGHWNDRMGRFIDQVGDRTDFISWHIYSTFYDDGDPEPHSVGANADWQLDLVENYARNETGRDIPIVISEFGGGFKSGTSWWNAYSEERDWYVLKSVMGKTMTLFERPDRVEMAIPFIVGKAAWYPGYETNAYPWVTFRKVGGVWVQTHLPKFFAFWSRVEGDRFPVESSDPDIQVHAFATNNIVNLCLNNIDTFVPAELDLAALLEPGMSVQSATVTRLYWDGSAPVLDVDLPMGAWSNLALAAEEAAVVRLVLNQPPSRDRKLYQKSQYGDQTILAYTGTPRSFTVLADMHCGPILKASLKVGVTRSFGSGVAPLVVFNGTPLPQATDWPGGTQEGVPGGAGGRDQFDGTIRMAVPPQLVQATNTVDVSFASAGGFVSTVILDLSSELPFDPGARIGTGDTTFVMDWDSSPSLHYLVSKATNLTVGIWMEAALLPGTGGPVAFTNEAVEPSAFFKLDALIP